MVNMKYVLAISMLYGFSKSSLETFYKETETNDDERKLLKLSSYSFQVAGAEIARLRKQLTKKQHAKLLNMTIKLDKEFEKLESKNDGKTSPQLLLMLCLDWIMNIKSNATFKAKFVGFNIPLLIDWVFSHDKYKDHVRSHSDTILNVLK
jgi:hypothetical protein